MLENALKLRVRVLRARVPRMTFVVKYQLHAPCAVTDRVDKGAVQVVAGVRVAVVDGLLAACQYNRLGAVLYHVAQRAAAV